MFIGKLHFEKHLRSRVEFGFKLPTTLLACRKKISV